MVDINTLRIGHLTVLEIKGRMDSASRDILLELVERELKKPDQRLVFNLADVDYLSTSGLKVLRKVQEMGGPVRIAQASVRVREVLQITGLDTIYQLFENQAQAIHTISPVVNAHTHLELGWLDAVRPGVKGQPFVDWILGTVAEARVALGNMREKVSQIAAEKGIRALIESGTTTVCDISAQGVSIEPLLKSGLRGIVFVEVVGINREQAAERMSHARRLIDQWRPHEDGIKLGLAIHAPYSVTPELWKEALAYARAEKLPVCIHAAESPAELEFFTKGTGDVAEANTRLEMNLPSPGKTPIHYLEDIGALDVKPLLVHCVQVDDADIRRIKASGSAVVHCPRSNLRLRCGRMPLEKFLAEQVPVYLGTDSLGSSPSLNVLDEVEVAVALHHGSVPAEQVQNLAHLALAHPASA